MSVHDADYKKVKKLFGIPEDEPIFVLRAQDKLSVATIARYTNLAASIEDEDVLPNEEWFEHMRDIAQEFAEWQDENADKVKVPD